jgi:hypothetical protein
LPSTFGWSAWLVCRLLQVEKAPVKLARSRTRRAVVDAGRVLLQRSHAQLGAKRTRCDSTPVWKFFTSMAIEAVGILFVRIVAGIGADDAGEAIGVGEVVALQPLPVERRMRLVDEAAGLLVVIGQRDAVALDILAGLIGAGTEIAGQRDRIVPVWMRSARLKNSAVRPKRCTSST